MNKTNEALFKDDCIHFKGKKILYRSLLTREFYSYADSMVEKYNFGLIVDNTLYTFFICPMLSIIYFIHTRSINSIKIEVQNERLRYIIINSASSAGIMTSSISHKFSFDKIIIFFSACYLLLVLLLQGKKVGSFKNQDIWLSRAEVEKRKFFPVENTFLLEETKIGMGSMYVYLPLMARISCLIRAYVSALQEYKNMTIALNNNSLEAIGIVAGTYFSKRLVHIYFWGNILEENIIYHQVKNKIYTGVYNCAYASIEAKIAKKMHKMLVVIPHGVQSSFKFPSGLSGDLYYCTSDQEKEMLNHLYGTNKFVFDDEVVKKMYQIKKDKNKRTKNIVLFTDGNGNEYDVILAEFLESFLSKRNKILYIKFHDGEKQEVFSRLKNIKIEDNITVALDGNVCIARYSSVLVDAIYGGSDSVQVILEGDAQVEADLMPSLHDPRIMHVRGIEELCRCLETSLS